MYNAICREVAKEYENIINFVDINRIFLQYVPEENLYEYLLEDQIHLSQKGHDFYFTHFCPVIRRILSTHDKNILLQEVA